MTADDTDEVCWVVRTRSRVVPDSATLTHSPCDPHGAVADIGDVVGRDRPLERWAIRGRSKTADARLVVVPTTPAPVKARQSHGWIRERPQPRNPTAGRPATR